MLVTALCEFLPPTSLLLDVSQFAFWAFNFWLSTSGHMRSLSSRVSEIDCESLSCYFICETTSNFHLSQVNCRRPPLNCSMLTTLCV